MTPTEKARRVDALYQCETKHVLAEMVVHREADLEDARAENAELQNDADLLRSMLQAKRKDAHALMSENAKLRELVRDMWRDIPKSESCGWDTDANCCSGSDECKGECAYWYRMHDLGVEVDA